MLACPGKLFNKAKYLCKIVTFIDAIDESIQAYHYNLLYRLGKGLIFQLSKKKYVNNKYGGMKNSYFLLKSC